MGQGGGGRDGDPVLDLSGRRSARVHDHWLGGKDNFAPDRELAEAIAPRVPWVRAQVCGQRRFLDRAVRYLAAEAGIRQFLDIGTPYPQHA